MVFASPLKIDQRSADDYDQFLDGMMFVGKRGFNPGFYLQILDFSQKYFKDFGTTLR